MPPQFTKRGSSPDLVERLVDSRAEIVTLKAEVHRLRMELDHAARDLEDAGKQRKGAYYWTASDKNRGAYP